MNDRRKARDFVKTDEVPISNLAFYTAMTTLAAALRMKGALDAGKWQDGLREAAKGFEPGALHTVASELGALVNMLDEIEREPPKLN